MSELLQAVRRGCSPAIWSKAVELARAGSIIATAESAQEVDLRVATDGGLKCAAVTLYPEDVEWSCDCDSSADACVHAAAAAIAWNRARSENRSLKASTLAHVGYRLHSDGAELVFERVLASASGETLLLCSLSAASKAGEKFAATAADMTVEVQLGTRPRGALIPAHWAKLWAALTESEDVRVDGKKVHLRAVAPVECLHLRDGGGGFLLKLEAQGGLKRWHNGIAQRGAEIFLVADTRAALPELELLRLRTGIKIPAEEVAALVSDILPRLSALYPLQVESTRLPEACALPLQLSCEVQPQGPGLSVLAKLVYGEPPSARLDGDRCVWLGAGPLPKRRPREEARLQAIAHERLGVKLGVRSFINADDAQEFLAALARIEVRPRSERTKFTLTAPLQWHAQMDGEVFSLSASAEGETLDHARVLNALRAGQSLLALSDGRFAPIPISLRHEDVITRLLHARAALTAVEKIEAAHLVQELAVPAPPSLAPLLALFRDTPSVPHAELPSDLRASLRDYQQQGVDWLVFMRNAGLGALLADDMGLGKTLQTIAALPVPAPGFVHLVVCPTSVLGVWEREFARFRPGLRVRRYHGPRRAFDADAQVVLSTYGTLRQDLAAFMAQRFAIVVLDEAQAIKNPDSQSARACFALPAKTRIALSGTPVENSLDELWSVSHFLNAGVLGSRDAFARNLGARIGVGDAAAAQALRTRVRPFILRRSKEHVAKDLPPRTDNVLLCELDTNERTIYDAMHAASVPGVLQALAENNDVLGALEALLRLRQAAAHPRLLPGHERYATHSAKLRALSASLSSLIARGHKALVFSQWMGFLDIVEEMLKEESITHARLDGSTVDRDSVVARFGADDGPPVMLISLKAGGTGLTLTRADYVFLLDPWWNPAVEEQAAARAHRIGQTKPVFVYRLIAKDTIEERLLALQDKKRALFDAALGDAALATRLTKDDIHALLL